MLKLWLLKRYLKRTVTHGGSVALWLSGGKDSRLLLEVLLDLKLPFSILRFAEGWSKEQRAVIDELTKRHNLRIYTYDASWGVLMGNAQGEIALARGYAVGANGETSVLIRDLVDAPYKRGRCIDDIELVDAKPGPPKIRFDLHLVGTKRKEGHWTLGEAAFLTTKRWEVGNTDFCAPLYRFSDQDVIQALELYGIYWREPSDLDNSGNVACCTNCLHPANAAVFCPKLGENIAPREWAPQENLAAFQASFGGR